MLLINNLLLLFTFAVCSSTACTKEMNEKPKVKESATEQVESAEEAPALPLDDETGPESSDLSS